MNLCKNHRRNSMESKAIVPVSSSIPPSAVPLAELPNKDLIHLLKNLFRGIPPPPSYTTMDILEEADRRLNLIVSWSPIANIAPMAMEQSIFLQETTPITSQETSNETTEELVYEEPTPTQKEPVAETSEDPHET